MPRYRPFDGSEPLFKIGLSPLETEDWIDVDDQLERYLVEKDRLLAERFNDVFVAEQDTETAQCEVLDRITAHVLKWFPGVYIRFEDTVSIGNAGRTVSLCDPDLPPLVRAARLVQEDLIVMRHCETGWRLVAACLCFPSSWDLLEKFGKPLQDIHQPIPEFGEGSRNAHVINRIFDNLQPDLPAKRLNWSVYGDDNLFHNNREEQHAVRRRDALEPEAMFLRVEFQTLTKLQKTGDILFTVRIYIDPMSVIRSLPDSANAYGGFAKLLSALTKEQLEYKGLETLRDGLVQHLEAEGRKVTTK